MKPHAQQVGAEPRPTGDDVPEDGEVHDAALPDHATPTGVQDERIPQHDDEGPVLLGIPTPESPPRLVGPNTAQHGAHEAEQRGEAQNAIHHARQALTHVAGHHLRKESEHHIQNGQEACDIGGSVAQRHDDHVGGEPEVGIEHRLEHHHGVASEGEIVSHDLGGKTNHGGHRQPDGVFPERFKDQPEADRAPSDKNGRAVKIGHRRPTLEPHPSDEPQRVDHEGQLHQMQGRLAAPLGEVEPEPTAEEEGHDVQRGGFRERREAIVELFASRLVQGLAQA